MVGSLTCVKASFRGEEGGRPISAWLTCEALPAVPADTGGAAVVPSTAAHRVPHVGRAGLLRVGIAAGPAEAPASTSAVLVVAALAAEGPVVAAHGTAHAVPAAAHAAAPPAAAAEPVPSRHPAAAHGAAAAVPVAAAAAARGRELDADLIALEVVPVELTQDLVNLVALHVGVNVHEAKVLDHVGLDDRAVALEHLRNEARSSSAEGVRTL